MSSDLDAPGTPSFSEHPRCDGKLGEVLLCALFMIEDSE